MHSTKLFCTSPAQLYNSKPCEWWFIGGQIQGRTRPRSKGPRGEVIVFAQPQLGNTPPCAGPSLYPFTFDSERNEFKALKRVNIDRIITVIITVIWAANLESGRSDEWTTGLAELNGGTKYCSRERDDSCTRTVWSGNLLPRNYPCAQEWIFNCTHQAS